MINTPKGLKRLALMRAQADNTSVKRSTSSTADSTMDKQEAARFKASADKAENDTYNMNQHSIGRAFALGHSMMARNKADSLSSSAQKKDALRSKTLKDISLND